MLTFTYTPVSKAQLLAVLDRHAAADSFTRNTYWLNGKGCAVGCSLQSFTERVADHSEYERLFGIPLELAQVQDAIFEGLPEKDAKAWPVRFVEAIPEGKDLSLVWPRFVFWLLTNHKHGLYTTTDTTNTVLKQDIALVANLFQRLTCGATIPLAEWEATARKVFGPHDAFTKSHTGYACLRAAVRSITERLPVDDLRFYAADASECAAEAVSHKTTSTMLKHYKVQAAHLLKLLRQTTK